MKCILTGGAGFLGSHLAFELEQAGHEVVVIDLKLSRWHDLRFPEIVETQLSEHSDADLCVHLAAKVGRLFGEDDPMETITDNVGMTALVAQQCGHHGIRMAYASTSEVYGDNNEEVCDEYDGPFTLPHNVYGISKGFGEKLCEHYAPDGLTIFRFSMPYGPGLPAGRGRAAIINMLHQALHGKSIPVHIGAERSWCYVTDTVRAARMVLEQAEGGTFNVGRDDDPVLMRIVAELACALADADPGLIEMIPAPRMQTVVKRLSTERIRKLGWKPEIDLEEGMVRTMNWVRTLDKTGAIASYEAEMPGSIGSDRFVQTGTNSAGDPVYARNLGVGEPEDSVEATNAAEDLAAELGIDLATVTGTGKDGKITVGDVKAASG